MNTPNTLEAARIACENCDTEEADGKRPATAAAEGWRLLSYQCEPEDDPSVMVWWNWLGMCPNCASLDTDLFQVQP